MDILFLLYAEHEFNASTFTARVVASTLADMYAALTGALGALKGPLHGGANEEAMKMLEEIARPENAEKWVKDRLVRKEKIMGFGHRVYKTGDSRVPVLRELTREIGKRLGQEQWVAIGEALDRVMENEKNLYANADLYAAPVFHMMGIPTDLNTPLFACSRAAGWAAHVIEQQDNNRLIRPRCLYTGPDDRKYVPVEQRR
jgi:citrate synthase